MIDVRANIERVLSEIPECVRLVAVSKFHPIDKLMAAYNAGQRRFGESRVQELLEKEPRMPEDVEWHFIGHLQTNKVKQLIGKTSLIESIDSERLLDMVDRESRKAGVMTRVLMQVHVAREETKFGFLPDELLDYFRGRRFENLTNTHICGVMGMASNTDDERIVSADFEAIAKVYGDILEACPDLRGFDTLSMGMSGDWPLAVNHGSNLIRIGTAIFGPREY